MQETLPDLSILTPKIVNIASIAAEYIKKELNLLKASDIETKEEHSLVSYVDQNAEKLITESLKPLIPSAGFITEEATINDQE